MHYEPGPPSDESIIHSQGTSLTVQGLRLCVPNTGRMGWIPGSGAKLLHAELHIQRTQENKQTKNYIHKSAHQIKANHRVHKTFSRKNIQNDYCMFKAMLKLM